MAACTVVLCVLSAVVGLIYLYLSWNFNFWKKRGVEGPKPKIVVGTLPCVIRGNRNLAFEFQELYEKYKKTGERFIGVFMTKNPQILVVNPTLAREVMVTNFKSFRSTEACSWVNRKLEEVSTRNPFMSSGSEWKELRSDIVGGLSPSRLKQAYPIVMEICKKLNNYVKASSSQMANKKIEVKTLCLKYTIEIIADFVWGFNADTLTLEEPANEIFKMSKKFVDGTLSSVGYFNLSGLMPIIRTMFSARLFPEETDKYFTEVQKNALDMRNRNRSDRSDFLNYLIQLQEKKNISHTDMVGQSMTVLLDGFETTASVMAHTLYYLADNQNVQENLRKEILSNLDENGCLSYDTLLELPYLDQCMNETIRIVSIVPVFTRICTETTILEARKGHKVTIEPDMTIHIPTYSFHHDPDIYPNPMQYEPDRFANGRAKELNQRGYFFPFGDGPRICVGMKLGQLEAKAGIVELIKNFKLSKVYDTEKIINSNSFMLGLSGDLLLEFEAI